MRLHPLNRDSIRQVGPVGTFVFLAPTSAELQILSLLPARGRLLLLPVIVSMSRPCRTSTTSKNSYAF